MKHTGCNQSNQGASYISLIAFLRFPSIYFCPVIPVFNSFGKNLMFPLKPQF